MSILGRAATVAFVICLPILLLTTSLRFEVNEIRLYEYGFDRYQVSLSTGLERAELVRAAREMIDYFNSEEELLQVRVKRGGVEFDLFNEREIAHLKDVKGLVQLCYRVQWAVLAYVVGYIGYLALRARRRGGHFWQELSRKVLWGSGLSLALMLALGVGALLGFERLLLGFHLLAFRNFLWVLDPSRDYMIMMFGGILFDGTLFLALAMTIEALILGGMAAGLLAATRGKR